MKILCCGEAVVDMLPQFRGAFAPHVGGAAANTAVALAQMGVDTGFFGAIGADPFGDDITDTLAQAGVDLSMVPAITAPSTLAFVHRDGPTQSYSFYDNGSAGQTLSPDHLPQDLPKDLAILCFGGISLIHDRPGTAFEILQQNAGAGRLTWLDANIRPSLIADEPAYRARLLAMMARADIVKLSDEDIDWLGTAELARLIAKGESLVLQTHGAAGATCHSWYGSLRLPAPRVEVIDSVGAGDVFNAAFMAGMVHHGVVSPLSLGQARERQLRDILTYAITTATKSTTRAGGTGEIPA